MTRNWHLATIWRRVVWEPVSQNFAQKISIAVVCHHQKWEVPEMWVVRRVKKWGERAEVKKVILAVLPIFPFFWREMCAEKLKERSDRLVNKSGGMKPREQMPAARKRARKWTVKQQFGSS